MPASLMPILLASVTDFFLDPIVNWGTDFISATGLPAVRGAAVRDRRGEGHGEVDFLCDP